jgi:hypothetical protein
VSTKWKVVLYKFLANLFKVLKGTDEMLDCCELSLLEKLKIKGSSALSLSLSYPNIIMP